MKLRLFTVLTTTLCLLALIPAASSAQATPKASGPVLITSCGQSPGPNEVAVLAKRAGVEYMLKLDAEASDVATKKYNTLIVVTGASLKGMGAAGVSINEEIARVEQLIAAAKKQGMTVIGAHVEGMSRRAAQAAPGDNSDEISIDAVCPKSNFIIVWKEGDSDGRFTTLSKTKKVPLVAYDKKMELLGVLKTVFAK